ncbi:MAG TPA: hypothetical protein VFK82_07500 [Burkholderiaceae bacterium]|nr:hypothetical protein [Burkholderiaceae bacterium]
MRTSLQDAMTRPASAGIAAALLGIACLAQAETVAEIKPEQLAEIKRLPVINAELPTPAFRWSLETTRSFRGKRMTTETWQPSPNGLAQVMIEDPSRSPGDRVIERVSLRGLMYVRTGEQKSGVQFSNLRLPIQPGDKFTVTISREGRTMTKRCVAAEREPAAKLHPAIPGNYVPIDCAGEMQYRGMTLKADGDFAWIEALNLIFFPTESVDYGAGTFVQRVRISAFQLR